MRARWLGKAGAGTVLWSGAPVAGVASNTVSAAVLL